MPGRIPFAEAAVVAMLAGDAELGTVAPPTRIGTQLPQTFRAGQPGRIRVSRRGGGPLSSDPGGTVDQAAVQLECFAADQDDAHVVAELALQALARVVTGLSPQPAGFSVADVRRYVGPLWSPDPDTGAARYLVGVYVTLAALP